MKVETKSRITVFVLSALVWFALTDIREFQEVIAGLVMAAVVTLIAGKFFITTTKQRGVPHRIIAAMRYFFKFLWEMIKANVHVALIVLHPMLPIKPGIVKIKTKLSKDSAITILTNSITLTPGTLTVDINPDTKEIYIHCIEVHATTIDENTQQIGWRFEHILAEVFE